MIGPEPLVSVVVPVLDEAAGIGDLLDHLGSLPGWWEVVVADGGSTDDTVAIASGHAVGARVIDAPAGRARQQNAGAEAARGEVLVFLHADSRLPPGANAAIAEALGDPTCPGGNFALRFDGRDRFSRVLTWWYARQRAVGVYYGDSTIWVRRGAWDALGGFRELPIMEDYELVRRLEAIGRTACLPGPAVTSSRRWLAAGVPRTVVSWVVIRWLWIVGVPADRLAQLYRHVR